MTARELWRRDPTQVLMRAVEGMLPKNNLQRDRLRKLRVFVGPEHPFGDTPMVLWSMPPKQLDDQKLGWAMPSGFVPMNAAAYARRMRGARHVAGAAVQQQQLEAGAGSHADADAAPRRPAAGEQQQQQQQQRRQQAPAPDIGFDDLLAADERQFIQQCKERGGGVQAR
jgi:hypothetical protein